MAYIQVPEFLDRPDRGTLVERPERAAATFDPPRTSREQAFAQYTDLYRSLGRPQLTAEEVNDFEGWWKNAVDSGLMQGPGYSRPWAALWPEIEARARARLAPGPASSPAPAATSAATTPSGFEDPYTAQLEAQLRQQLAAVQAPRPNPALEAFTRYLQQQFEQASTAPGFTPEELALLRTQVIEPIEARRTAGHQRVLQRAAARGMLPSSGLTELEARTLDAEVDRLRTQAERDLAIQAIDRRRQDLQRALTLGQVAAMTVPEWQQQQDAQRRQEQLTLASLLYDLPLRAQQQALSVIQGTPGPESLTNQAIALSQLRQAQQAQQAQQWLAIGQLLAGLF